RGHGCFHLWTPLWTTRGAQSVSKPGPVWERRAGCGSLRGELSRGLRGRGRLRSPWSLRRGTAEAGAAKPGGQTAPARCRRAPRQRHGPANRARSACLWIRRAAPPAEVCGRRARQGRVSYDPEPATLASLAGFWFRRTVCTTNIVTPIASSAPAEPPTATANGVQFVVSAGGRSSGSAWGTTGSAFSSDGTF